MRIIKQPTINFLIVHQQLSGLDHGEHLTVMNLISKRIKF